MDDINKKSKEELMRNLKPAGAYLDSLDGFQDLLGTIKQAENAAKEVLNEKPKITREVIRKDKEKATEKADEIITEAEVEEEEPVSVEELLERLDILIGLHNIKQSVKSLINFVRVRKLREEKELPNPPVSLHMVFTGNPGTGKTTVARILSELYKAIGVLSKGQLVEVDRSGLVAGFVGQTALKTAEVVESALGGILFIDEAYSLAPETGALNDFGRESIETLLKLMEDNRDDLIVIVAGYSEPMERFISSNPGLESRFNRYFLFEDYTGKELDEIFSSMCTKSAYVLTDEAREYALEHFCQLYDYRDLNFGNARHVRNFFENMVTVHSDRVSTLIDHTREDLTTVILEDLENAAEM